jgi:cytochrome c oxidase subunit 1
MGAGTLGVSRRHWDIGFADATLSFDYPETAYLMLALNGLFGILAALGGLAYVVVVVGSILFGQRVGTEPAGPAPAEAPPAAAVGQSGSAGSMALPGTAVLVAVFFVAFVLYYFVNWKYLSEVWPLS